MDKCTNKAGEYVFEGDYLEHGFSIALFPKFLSRTNVKVFTLHWHTQWYQLTVSDVNNILCLYVHLYEVLYSKLAKKSISCII